MSISRRNFISGIAAGIAAPAIVRPGILMPIRGALLMPPGLMLAGWSGDTWLLTGVDEQGRRVVERLPAGHWSLQASISPFDALRDAKRAIAPSRFQPADGKKPGF